MYIAVDWFFRLLVRMRDLSGGPQVTGHVETLDYPISLDAIEAEIGSNTRFNGVFQKVPARQP